MFVGHTEYLRDKTKSKETLMLLINNLKTVTVKTYSNISSLICY